MTHICFASSCCVPHAVVPCKHPGAVPKRKVQYHRKRVQIAFLQERPGQIDAAEKDAQCAA